MINLIKMYLFCLLKSRSFYVIIAIVSVIAWYNSYYIGKHMNSGDRESWLSQGARDNWDYLKSDALLGVNYDTRLLVNGDGTVTLFDEASVLLSSSFITLFTGILTILFLTEERNCGYNKNLVSCVKKRRYLIISKIVVIAIFIAIEFAVLLFVTELASLCYLRQFSHAVTWEQVRYMGVQFLLYTAYSSLIMMATLALKNSAVCMIINIFVSWNFTIIIHYYFYNMLARLCYFMFRISNMHLFYLLNYYLVPNIALMSANAPLGICIRGILVSLAAILFYNSISIVITEKRDV